MNFQFNQDGLPWNVRFDQTGAFDLVSTVAAKRGPTSYTFDVYSSEALTVNAAGHLVGDSHVNLTRAVIVPRTGARILCSPWTYSAQKGASFTCDDSSLSSSQLPYRIDPSSHSLTDNGTYYVNSHQGWSYPNGDGAPAEWDSAGSNAVVTFNTAGILPPGAAFISVGCSLHVVYNNGPDYPDCHTGSFTNPQTVEVGYWVDHGSEEYSDDASVNNVTLTVTSWDPAPLLSPANGATGISLTPTLSWGGEYGSSQVYLSTTPWSQGSYYPGAYVGMSTGWNYIPGRRSIRERPITGR